MPVHERGAFLSWARGGARAFVRSRYDETEVEGEAQQIRKALRRIVVAVMSRRL